MTEQKNATCPACGKSAAVDIDAIEVFCPYCGTRFAAASPGGESELRAAYEKGDYARVLSETAEGVFERDRALGMLRSAAEYYVARERYLEEALELSKKRRAKTGLSRLLFGRDEYSESPIHKQWFEDAERLCSALAREARECLGGANEPLARALSLELVRSLLAQKSEKADGALYWPTVAVEHFSIPLFANLDTEALRALCEEYGSYYKRYNRLPNQEKVLGELKKELESR